MAFRNDREAMAARIRSLENENAVLREQLRKALNAVEDGTDTAATLRAELDRVRTVTSDRGAYFGHVPSTRRESASGDNDLVASAAVVATMVLGAAGIVAFSFTSDTLSAFKWLCSVAAVVLLVVGIIVFFALRSLGNSLRSVNISGSRGDWL